MSLRDQLKAEEVKTSKLNAELAHGREMLQGVQQPHGYLMSRVKEQRAELERHKARVCTLEGELEAMQREKGVLVETKNQMAADLERLLNHREVSEWSSRSKHCTRQSCPQALSVCSRYVYSHTIILPLAGNLGPKESVRPDFIQKAY